METKKPATLKELSQHKDLTRGVKYFVDYLFKGELRARTTAGNQLRDIVAHATGVPAEILTVRRFTDALLTAQFPEVTCESQFIRIVFPRLYLSKSIEITEDGVFRRLNKDGWFVDQFSDERNAARAIMRACGINLKTDTATEHHSPKAKAKPSAIDLSAYKTVGDLCEAYTVKENRAALDKALKSYVANKTGVPSGLLETRWRGTNVFIGLSGTLQHAPDDMPSIDLFVGTALIFAPNSDNYVASDNTCVNTALDTACELFINAVRTELKARVEAAKLVVKYAKALGIK